MHQRADDVHAGIAMRDHHALRPRGGAAGVIDREQIGFVNFRARKFAGLAVDQCFIIEPAVSPAPFSATKCSTLGNCDANAVDRARDNRECAQTMRAPL